MGVARVVAGIFIFFQAVFLLIGLGVTAVGVWLELEYKSFLELISSEEFSYGPYLIIAIGAVVTLISLTGIIGACCRSKFNKCLLGFYAVLAFIILILQLAGAMAAFVFREQAETIIKTALNESLSYYGTSESVGSIVTGAWDNLQNTQHCCGIESASDWIGRLSNNSIVFPKSCCLNETDFYCNSNAEKTALSYGKGCLGELVELLSMNMLIVGGIGAGVVLVQSLLIIFSIILLCITDYDD